MSLALSLKTYENLQSLKACIAKAKLASSSFMLDPVSRDGFLKDNFDEFYTILTELLSKNPNLSFQKQLELLQSDLEKLKVLDIVLAFEPSEEFINTLVKWIEDNVSKDVILRFGFNNEIIGGCVLSYEGKYLDLSAKKSLVNLFQQNPSFALK